MNRMDAVTIQINLGAVICEKLRNLFFTREPWAKCTDKVSKKFTELKINARLFFTTLDEIEMLREVSKYNEQDLLDFFHTKTE